MKKKNLKKMISILSRRVLELEKESKGCQFCENYEPKTVKFTRWEPPTIVQSIKESGNNLLEKYLERKINDERKAGRKGGE
jgi:hypothetical protein